MGDGVKGASAGRPGLFIVFEGVEGAGKTTQIRMVSERLARHEVDHLLVREPGGTAVGERARAVVLDPSLEICPESELFLYLTSRAEFVRQLVVPALEQGRLVVADRYELSTFAYQAAARGLDLESVEQANHLATGGLRADLTILLRIDPVEGRGRQSGDGDRLERERAEFHAKVAAAYDRFAASDDTIVAVKADENPETVHEAIWQALSRRWPERFPPGDMSAGNIWAGNEFQEEGRASEDQTLGATRGKVNE